MKKSKNEILGRLYARQRAGIKPGLSRTVEILRELGKPHEELISIHIAGTNGKGSQAAMLASILMEAGYKTGLYTSPHLVEFNERIRINGEMISDEDIIRLAELSLPIAENIDGTFFEITTAMAFKYFAEHQVDIAIVETGMGGRYDSTNVLHPLMSVISRVGFDHAEYLGSTIEKITFEKAGIIKPGIPVIIGENRVDIEEFLKNRAISLLAPYLVVADSYRYENYRLKPDLTIEIDLITPENEFPNILIPLAGRHQAENAMSVMAAIELMSPEFDISEHDIYLGFENVIRNTGLDQRCKLIQKSPAVIFDVSHNTQAIESLAKMLKESPYGDKKFNVLFSAMADKEIDQILKELKPIASTLIIAKPDIERAASTSTIAEMAREIGIKVLREFEDVSEAYNYALNLGEPLIATGSFYLIGEILESIHI